MRLSTSVPLALVFSVSSPTFALTTFDISRTIAPFARPGNTVEIGLADLNGDGVDDIVVTSQYDNPQQNIGIPIQILLNDGRGNFSDATSTVIEGAVPTTVHARKIVIADFNGDRRPDVFIADHGFDAPPFPGAQSVLLLSKANGKYFDATGNLPQQLAYTHSAAAADIDGSGRVALFLGNNDQVHGPQLLMNDGAGRFTVASGRIPAAQANIAQNIYLSTAFVDVNGDGCPDLVLGGNENTQSVLLVNDCAGKFSLKPNALPPKSFADGIVLDIRDVRIGPSGKPDLLFAMSHSVPVYSEGRAVQVLINTGDGTFRDESAQRLNLQENTGNWIHRLYVADTNGDCIADIVPEFYGPFSAEARIYLGDRSGRFTRQTSNLPFTALMSRPIDIDGSGRTSIFTSAGNGFLVDPALGTGCTPRPAAVFSTAQAASQSFLRVFNTGVNAGRVTIALADSASGQAIGKWTSPSIGPGVAAQYFIGEVEAGLGRAFAKPAYYSVAVESNITGSFQHVLWRPSDGTLTNLSTCETGVTADSRSLNNVHTSTLGAAYPSSIVVNNTGTSAATVTLGIYDARDGARLGAYTTPPIPADAQVGITIAAIEAAAHITPTASMYHYVVKAEGAFSGFLQHLVNNTGAGVITDMTTACNLEGSTVLAATAPLKVGAVFSTAQSSAQSFLRFFNTGTNTATATVTLKNAATGATLGTWTTPAIAPMSEQQFAIGSVEAEAGIAGPKPNTYAIGVQSGFGGYFQHVLFRPADGTLTNLSTCDDGVTADGMQVAGVHSTLIGSGFPSSVVIANTGSAPQAVQLAIYDARNGALLGTSPSPSIPAGGQAVLAVSDIEAAAGITPDAGMFHYVVNVQGPFTGFLQNLVNNTKVGAITDMTTACAL